MFDITCDPKNSKKKKKKRCSDVSKEKQKEKKRIADINLSQLVARMDFLQECIFSRLH